MTDEKKITKGLDKDLMQLIDAEMNDPVIGKLLNRNAAYALGKEIKLLFIDKACEWLYEYNRKQADKMFGTVHTADVTINVAEFRKAMEGGEE